MQLEIDFKPPDLPRAFWEGSKIVITPRPSEYEKGADRLRYSQKWNGPPENACQSYKQYIERVELRPFTVTDRQTKAKRKRFKAIVIYFGGKEENPTPDAMRAICPELGGAWGVWSNAVGSTVLAASHDRVIEWLCGGEVTKSYPCILEK